MREFRLNNLDWVRYFNIALAILLVAAGIQMYVRGTGTGHGAVWGLFSLEWAIGIVLYWLVNLGLISFTIWGAVHPDRYSRIVFQRGEEIAARLGWFRWVVVGLALLAPLLLVTYTWGLRFRPPAFRLLFLVICALAVALALPTKSDRLLRTIFALIAVTASYHLLRNFFLITDNPFARTWSEGNRLWDYSLYFDLARYNFTEVFQYPNYLSPGRHGLWGLPFLFFPDISIYKMRIWDFLLWTIPYLLLGLVLFKSMRERSFPLMARWLLALWTLLFFFYTQIYAPLILSAILVLWGYNREKFWQTVLITIIASFYAGISRWTWMFAPAAWTVLLALFDTVSDKGWKRIQKPIFLGIAGAVSGLLSVGVMRMAFPQPGASLSTSLSQPLLWDRLWPTATNPIGIIPSLTFFAGPLLIFLIWSLAKKVVRLDWLSILGLTVVLAGFLGAGLVASVKIGGGSNLHNLDMFLVSLVLVAGILIYQRGDLDRLPRFSLALIAVILFLPIWFTVQAPSPERRIPDELIEQTMGYLDEFIAGTGDEGDVLFIDQRQLFTFGELEDLPLVPEYELKHLMNQVMGRNQGYLDGFRADLEAKRFRLIVMDPLNPYVQPATKPFHEEGNLFREEVVLPLLQNYRVVLKEKTIDVWLLIPLKPGEEPDPLY
jgi:hypothetical protein